jgi:hypothetical protein
VAHGKPDSEVVPETPQLVVPAFRAPSQGAIGEVGVLGAQQGADEVFVDLDPGAAHAP